tara:strand:- start:9074 stop:9553 length:480 start_codon:yes stop_codon:yes gene_type:complete
MKNARAQSAKHKHVVRTLENVKEVHRLAKLERLQPGGFVKATQPPPPSFVTVRMMTATAKSMKMSNKPATQDPPTHVEKASARMVRSSVKPVSGAHVRVQSFPKVQRLVMAKTRTVTVWSMKVSPNLATPVLPIHETRGSVLLEHNNVLLANGSPVRER